MSKDDILHNLAKIAKFAPLAIKRVVDRKASAAALSRLPGRGGSLQEWREEIDRLRRERRQIIEQREENQELVKFAQEERSLAKIREERERRRDQIRQANIVKRAWWRIAGEPGFESADD